MRRIIIDTDTASDDAVALIMALREPSVHVELITTVAGNVPLHLCTKNALLSIDIADTYAPPVYEGIGHPMMRELVTGEHVHGEDGLGNLFLPDPKGKVRYGHAVNAMLETVDRFDGDIEIIALGPLTNVATAIVMGRDIMKKVRRITIMGGAKMGSSAFSPVAEYNIFADAEAAQIVMSLGVPLTLVGLDVCQGAAALNQKDIGRFLESGSPIAKFCIECNRSLLEFYTVKYRNPVITLPDPTAVAAALWPDCIQLSYDAYAFVEVGSPRTYGQLVLDPLLTCGEKANATVIEELYPDVFKDKLFDCVQV